MWCPSVSLSVWANAWLAGRAAPDDVLDALTAWAPAHSVAAYDSIAAGRTGLPWPDVDEAGAMSLLQTVRTAAGGHIRTGWPTCPAIAVLLPVPGDVRGLPAGTQFARDALRTGEALLFNGPDEQAVGVVPEFASDGAERESGAGEICWSVYSVPAAPVPDAPDLGEAEFALRSAVRGAAEVLGRLDLAACGDQNPRALVEEAMAASDHHLLPDHAPTRAARVLSTAAHVDAIVLVSKGPAPIGTHNVSDARTADDAIRPLAAVVRAARLAAISAILQSAWH